jgi:NAD(P)-dependent dehydrogenase (short-subunit alcohol dehydrogenase family)
METLKKVAFITGGNRGIGLETARALTQSGVHVVIGSRDLAKGEASVQKLKNEGLSVKQIQFDVNNASDHRQAAAYFEKEHGRLDILVNNAGVWLESDREEGPIPNNTSHVSADILLATFQANFFSVVEVTQTLLPLIRKSVAGRIVNLSSILGSLTLHSQVGSSIYSSKALAYDTSKTALNSFTVHLAHELKDTPIKVNSAHPGWVKTDMGGKGAMMEVTDGAKTSVQLALLPSNGPTGGFFHLGDALPW